MPFINAVRQACARDLVALGFRKRMIGVYTWEFAPDFLGVLGLNEATHREDGAVELNPVVSVRSQEVERLVAELAGRKQHSYSPSTISTNIGYIMPQRSYYRQLFRNPLDVDSGVKELVEVVRVFGIPFMRRNTTLEALCNAMEHHLGWAHHIAFALPVAYLLVGKSGPARAHVACRLRELERTPSAATDQYRTFATNLQRWLAVPR